MANPLGERQMKIYRQASVRRTSSPSFTRLDGLEVRHTGKRSSAARLSGHCLFYVGGDSSLRAPAHHVGNIENHGGPARRSAAGPTLQLSQTHKGDGPANSLSLACQDLIAC